MTAEELKEKPSVGPRKLGDKLVAEGVITQEQLQAALEKQHTSGEYLGEILIDSGYASPEDVYGEVANLQDIPYVDVKFEPVDPEVLDLVPRGFADQYDIMPLSLNGNSIRIATADHLDIVAQDRLAAMTNYRPELVLSSRKEIREAIALNYNRPAHLDKDLQELVNIETAKTETEEEPQQEAEDLEQQATDAPVVRYVNLLIQQAIERGASDLHLEPRQKEVQARMRIDGVLHEAISPSRKMYPAVLSRIKILNGLDIAERRLPQDGRCRLEDRQIDIRTSTLPTIYGEKVVMRLLDKSTLVLGLDELGILPFQQELYRSALLRTQGIILVTGPTGSGKTTTLYSGLAYISTPEKNVITVEDPVEYEFSNINQVQVKPNIGLTFANVLRTMLRQDPDVVMVGEIRDEETGSIAVRASLTGHLVLSSLHTNSAVAAISRLIDMGVKPYLLASSLSLLMAQRLIRRICAYCYKAYTPSTSSLYALELPEDGTYYRGTGCSYCNQSGFRGRIGIMEMLPVTREMGKLIVAQASDDALWEQAIEEEMVTIRQAGAEKVKQGLTTPEEIVAATEV